MDPDIEMLTNSRKRRSSNAWEECLPSTKRRKTHGDFGTNGRRPAFCPFSDESDAVYERNRRSMDVYYNRFVQLFVIDKQDPSRLEQMRQRIESVNDIGDVDLIHSEYEAVCKKFKLNPGKKYHEDNDELRPGTDEIPQRLSIEDELIAFVNKIDFEHQNAVNTDLKNLSNEDMDLSVDNDKVHENGVYKKVFMI